MALRPFGIVHPFRPIILPGESLQHRREFHPGPDVEEFPEAEQGARLSRIRFSQVRFT